ncbi:hypothetical protein [Aeromonas hydrophila]|uniref:hypothetical protein n=1 Tax=Aeromonas hydrophila TaxID=644 RepID=UPI001A9262D5|nr:hypothetical protein [Aeromonas hydrophila]MBO0407068.1 hypothetical protein [Aeromonas hydrophila]
MTTALKLTKADMTAINNLLLGLMRANTADKELEALQGRVYCVLQATPVDTPTVVECVDLLEGIYLVNGKRFTCRLAGMAEAFMVGLHYQEHGADPYYKGIPRLSANPKSSPHCNRRAAVAADKVDLRLGQFIRGIRRRGSTVEYDGVEGLVEFRL